MCIVTRESADDDALLRFVLSPDGVVTPDLARKLPGRGVWVSLSRKVLAEAVKKQAFARGFEGPAKADADLPDRVGTLLRQQALSTLMLARKAGQAVAGSMKVESTLTRGPVRVLLHADVAQPDGCRKLDKLAQPKTVIFRSFRSDEMDLAFGRPNVIHAAVASGGIAARMVDCIRRIQKFEDLEMPGSPGVTVNLEASNSE
jgi:uncharacterized protein